MDDNKVVQLIETMYFEMKSGYQRFDLELQKTNDKMDRGFNRLETELRKTNAEIEVMKPDIRDLKEDVQVLKHELNGVKGTVLRIETDHGDKLGMLFDAYHTNEDYYHDLKEKLERKKVI